MAQIFIDHLSNLAAEEDRGVMRSLTRLARVKLTPIEAAANRSPDILGLALAALTAEGLGPLHTFPALSDPRDPDHIYRALVCTRRSPSLAKEDPLVVDVILKYEHLLEGHNQRMIDAPQPVTYGKGRTSIVEKSSNFFYPFGIVDETKKTQILVAHTFPDWDKRVIVTPHDKRYPRTIFQGGEINIPFPQSNFHLQGLVKTGNPVLLAREIVATINELEWMGEPPTKWICSECQWEVNDPIYDFFNFPVYKMGFEFQYNFDGWDPTIAFHDNQTGRPPAGIVGPAQDVNGLDANGVRRFQVNEALALLGDPNAIYPAGVWQVPALRRVNFNTFFNTVFEGA